MVDDEPDILEIVGYNLEQAGYHVTKAENGKEAEVRSAAFHEDKWLNTWRQERKKEALDTQASFERGKESAPPQRSFGDLLRSQLPSPDGEGEPENDPEDFISLIVEADNMAFYMGNLKAIFSGELPPEPRTTDEALRGPYAEQWKKAMDTEMQTLLERGTWELTELPPGKKPVGVKWVFKIKTNADGSLDKFKARLVAKGFTQI